jgi:flagellar basal-body rod modification protein FlgD
MQISGTTSADSPYSSTASSAGVQSSELGKDAFMKLLVTQIRNQDPLQPTDNQDFIAQLAQFSTLEQTQALNDNIVGLAVLQQSNALLAQLTSSSALIGQSVTYLDPESGEGLEGTVSSVKIEDGLAVLNIDGKSVPLVNVVEVNGMPAGAGDADGSGGDSTDDGDTQA